MSILEDLDNLYTPVDIASLIKRLELQRNNLPHDEYYDRSIEAIDALIAMYRGEAE